MTMAEAVAVSIAKAVEIRIRGTKFAQEFIVERSYADWDLKLEDLDTLEMKDSDKLRIDVVNHSTGHAIEQVARGKLKFTVPIDIAIRKKFGPADSGGDTGRINLAAIDELMELTQRIYTLFAHQELNGFPESTQEETEIMVAPFREHLRELRQFTSIVRVTFAAHVVSPVI